MFLIKYISEIKEFISRKTAEQSGDFSGPVCRVTDGPVYRVTGGSVCCGIGGLVCVYFPRMQGKDPLPWLASVLEKLPDAKGKDVESFLPVA